MLMVIWLTGILLEATIIQYFAGLFTSSESEWSTVINSIQCRVTAEQNEMMLVPVMDLEVKDALFSMHPEKSPGPDGMSLGFYQRF